MDETLLWLALGIVAFPFYVYVVFKCAGAGWTAGTVLWMGYWVNKTREKKLS